MGALSIIHAVSETTKDNKALPNEELKQVGFQCWSLDERVGPHCEGKASWA